MTGLQLTRSRIRVGVRARRYEVGEASVAPHCGASEVSRLPTEVVTPLTAVATPPSVLALGWALRSETAVLSVSSAEFTAVVWGLFASCSSAVRAVSFASTLARSDLISLTVPCPILTCASAFTEVRSSAAAWHTPDVGLGAGDAVVAVAPEPGDVVVVELHAARRSPAATVTVTATATMRNRPGLSTVARIVLPPLGEPRPLITFALSCAGSRVIVLPFRPVDLLNRLPAGSYRTSVITSPRTG